MIKLKEIVNKILSESDFDDGIDWDLHEWMDSSKVKIFDEFLYRNNSTMSKHIYWKLIPFARLKKIWEDFMKMGFVRDEKGIDMIEQIMTENTLRILIITELCGHTSRNPDEDYEEHLGNYVELYINSIEKPFNTIKHDPNQLSLNFKDKQKRKPKAKKNTVSNEYLDSFVKKEDLYDYPKDVLKEKILEELKDRFLDYFVEDPKSGHAYISDYGLEPLLKYLNTLRRAKTPEDKVYAIDKMLNVVHQRSDLSSWFVEGGTKSLSILAGNEEDEN